MKKKKYQNEPIFDLDILSSIKKTEEKKQRKQQRRRIFISVFFSSIIIGCLLYFYYFFIGDGATIKSVKITNNIFFTDEQVNQLIEINYHDNFYFLNTQAIEKKFSDWEICEVKVKKRSHQVLEIYFKNVDLIAYYADGDKLYLIDSDSKAYLYSNEYYETLKFLPYFVDYNTKEMKEVIEHLRNLDRAIVYQISEISHYITSYDENMLKFTMEDGNQLFLDFDAIPLLRTYNEIVENLYHKNTCIYFDAITGTANSRECEGE